MYNIKQVIDKMKKIANISSNVELANKLGISYNTLNTWLKRNKLPQETIFEFKDKYNISLDYLLLDSNDSSIKQLDYRTKESNHKHNSSSDKDKVIKYNFYGDFSELSIKSNAILYVNKEIKHNNGYYLINSNSVEYIAKVQFSIASDSITMAIDNNSHIVSKEEFNTINCGLITNIKLASLI